MPPSPVATIVPSAPTATQRWVSTQLTRLRLAGVGANWAVHVLPPSPLCSTTPWSPTAKHTLALGQVTPARVFVVPDGANAQLPPPSELVTTVPYWPTATQASALPQATSSSAVGLAVGITDGGVASRLQSELEAYPSNVEAIRPPLPTARHLVADRQRTLCSAVSASVKHEGSLRPVHATDASGLSLPGLWLDQLAPPSLLATIVPRSPTAKHVL